MNKIKNYIFFLIIFKFFCIKNFVHSGGSPELGEYLYFPQYTVLQITMAVVVPIDVKIHKTNVNLGLQVNYNLPYTYKEFTKPMYWAFRSFVDNYDQLTKVNLKNDYTGNNTRIKRDLSAGEMYASLKDILHLKGYDDSCLLKSVCEIAKVPLHSDDTDDEVLSEIIHFILTPSKHQGFDDDEHDERRLYEAAEELGKHGGDCDLIYTNCYNSPINDLTHLIENND